MMIDDVIRNAESESAIYFLLDAYVETTQFGERLPEYLTILEHPCEPRCMLTPFSAPVSRPTFDRAPMTTG